eukprot:Opistho-2@83344
MMSHSSTPLFAVVAIGMLLSMNAMPGYASPNVVGAQRVDITCLSTQAGAFSGGSAYEDDWNKAVGFACKVIADESSELLTCTGRVIAQRKEAKSHAFGYHFGSAIDTANYILVDATPAGDITVAFTTDTDINNAVTDGTLLSQFGLEDTGMGAATSGTAALEAIFCRAQLQTLAIKPPNPSCIENVVETSLSCDHANGFIFITVPSQTASAIVSACDTTKTYSSILDTFSECKCATPGVEPVSGNAGGTSFLFCPTRGGGKNDFK